MLKIVKNTVLVLFFGVVPAVLIGFLAFAGFRIYQDTIKNNPKGTALSPKMVSTLGQTANASDLNPKENAEKTPEEDKNKTPPKALDKKVELPSSVMLNAPLLYQAYNLNCEATSLAMALQYRKIQVKPQELMPKIGYADPTKKSFVKGKIVWGDPDKGFVGNEKGFLFTSAAGMAGGTGWGVNNGPIAKVADSFLPGSIELDNATLDDLKQALAQDKPVIFWHQRDDARREVLTYTTPEGKEVKQFQNHVNLLVGYKTDSKGQTIYYFNDPVFGKIQYKESDLIRIWAKYNNNIVVVN